MTSWPSELYTATRDHSINGGQVRPVALRTFGVCCYLDAHIRELELGGHHGDAVAFCTGNQKGESNWASNQFDQALGRWLTVNQEQMAHFTEAAFAGLKPLPYLGPLVSVLICVLSFLGLRPRRLEYL